MNNPSSSCASALGRGLRTQEQGRHSVLLLWSSEISVSTAFISKKMCSLFRSGPKKTCHFRCDLGNGATCKTNL
jgi:hypothetical protein